MKLGISIAMCTYNGAAFLPEQLQSIAAQKQMPDELVVCDDRSTDTTADIIRDFSTRVPFPVRFIVNSANLGSTANFENAISMCSGDIVALADQDDVWYANKLERMEQQFVQSEAIVAAFSDADMIRDDSQALDSRLWTSVGFGTKEQRKFSAGEATNVLIKRPVVTGATMAFRRKFFDRLRPIPREVVHDRWMSFLLSAIGPMALLSEPLMQYRQHRGQQIGVGPQHFADRLQRARTRGEDFHVSEVEFFRRVRARLERQHGEFPQAEIALPEITKKISHLERRIQMRRTVLGRVPSVAREVCNRGYWRYSAGWGSVAKDLFLTGTRS